MCQAMNHCNAKSVGVQPKHSEENAAAIHNDMVNERLLPDSFEPTENEVILGRGRQIATHPGNMLFKEFVLSHINEYSAAQTKALKSNILSHIVRKMRSNSSHNAGFVKEDSGTGLWTIAEDSAARIATAQIFRDALHDNYKSSKHFKQQRRNERKSFAKKQKALRDARGMGLAQQGFSPLAFPPAPVGLPLQQQVTSSGGAQDLLMGRLDTVLSKLARSSDATSGSLTSWIETSAALPNVPTTANDEAKEDVVSILCHHFGSRFDSNPFEPTPISEEAVVHSDSLGFD